MPAVHVDRLVRRGVNGANFDPSTGGGGAALRAFSYTITPAAGLRTHTISLQLRDEDGDAVAASVGARIDVFDDYALNSGFAAAALLGGVTAGTVLNTSNGGPGGMPYPTHIGTTNASGVLTFQIYPSNAAMTDQQFTLYAQPTSLGTTAPTWAAAQTVIPFTSSGP